MKEPPQITSDMAIHPVKAVAAYELVADQLRKAVMLGRFLPGQKLPPERDLAAQLGVSRTTVREAVRTIEAEGLVETRRGATGGIVVKSWANRADDLRRAVAGREVEIMQIFEFRLPNECAAARLAAERRTAQEARDLVAKVDIMQVLTESNEARSQLPNISRFRAEDNAFHLLIARASRNPYLFAAVEKSRTVMFMPVGAVFDRLEDNANEFHAEIGAEIVQMNADAAEDAMRRHIQSTQERLRNFLGPRGAVYGSADAGISKIARRRR